MRSSCGRRSDEVDDEAGGARASPRPDVLHLKNARIFRGMFHLQTQHLQQSNVSINMSLSLTDARATLVGIMLVDALMN